LAARITISDEERVADVAVQPRHRARLDVVHPVADDHLGAVAQMLDEARDLPPVVGEVGVRHDDVAALRGREPGQVRAPVAAAGLRDDVRARLARQLGAAVVGVVVRDDDLALQPGILEHAQRLGHAPLDVPLLVEARDDDGHLEGLLGQRGDRSRGDVRMRCGHRAWQSAPAANSNGPGGGKSRWCRRPA
jgi:hypothetical protein